MHKVTCITIIVNYSYITSHISGWWGAVVSIKTRHTYHTHNCHIANIFCIVFIIKLFVSFTLIFATSYSWFVNRKFKPSKHKTVKIWELWFDSANFLFVNRSIIRANCTKIWKLWTPILCVPCFRSMIHAHWLHKLQQHCSHSHSLPSRGGCSCRDRPQTLPWKCDVHALLELARPFVLQRSFAKISTQKPTKNRISRKPLEIREWNLVTWYNTRI